MDKLHVNLGADSYDIKFSDGFAELPEAMREINAPKRLLIVTDTNVERLYAARVREILESAGYECGVYAFAAGEENKSMDGIIGVCAECNRAGLDRKSMIVALGGGVVGDMAGFAAAIYMRGISFVQIPTTLLAQSDSSVGGKTGVDFRGGKNLLGAFHQPKLVYINVNTLKTLPEEQFVSGMGEVIKHGMIRDGEFFEYLRSNSQKIKSLDAETFIYMSKINCGIKAKVVEADEKENGLRAILNFGHTIGHAVESAYGFKKTHGECVGLGMIAASYIAVKRGLADAAVLSNLEEALEIYGFETRVKLPDNEEIWSFMQKDKKKSNGRLKFVLPTGIGSVVQTTDVSREEVFAALEYIGL